ncbi:MAG: M36 family metallopeptidase [Candidatus Wallbacteria bacterium]|nr:M36 family metallopeptidase [Candidatus Wallbacteria bacterium]
MKVKSIFLLCVFLVAASVQAFQDDGLSGLLVNHQEKDPLSRNTFERTVSFASQFDPDFEVVWDEETAVPTSITGRFVTGRRSGLVETFSASLPEGVELREVRKNEHHSVHQYYFNGLKVFPGTLVISGDQSGFMMSGRFVFATSIRNQAVLDAATAEKHAMDYLKAEGLRMQSSVEKVLFDTNNGLTNAYLCQIPCAQPLGDFAVVVNAQNGKIEYCDNMLAFVDGNASVYVTNPLKCDITTEDISNIKESGYLKGTYALVKNSDDDGAHSPENQFVYPVENTHFDEAHMYYHLDAIHAYFKSTFGYTGMDKQVTAYVHYGDNYDNAFFSPWGGYFAFGDGSKFNDLAREASIIYHEYTHAVTSNIAGLGTYGEAGGMNEAFSDYFGNTITDDPHIGEWAVNKAGMEFLRSCINDTHYPEDVKNECHHDSLMFSAPLWEMRAAFGKQIADELAHYCRYKISNSSKFADGLAAILKVDEERFGGAHKDQIQAIFTNRGIMRNDTRFRMQLKEKEMVRILLGTVSESETDRPSGC